MLNLDYQYNYINGFKVITIPNPKLIQKRKHKKRRINKKWAKKYGYYKSSLPTVDDKIYMLPDKTLIMNENTYLKLKENIEDITEFYNKYDFK